MHVDAVEVVGPERTAVAPLLPVGPEHEVVDRELTAPGKQVRERDAPFGSVEHVRLLDQGPRHRPALGGERVRLAHQRLLFGEHFEPGGGPVLSRDEYVIVHRTSHRIRHPIFVAGGPPGSGSAC